MRLSTLAVGLMLSWEAGNSSASLIPAPIQSRIVGGVPAPIDSFRFFVTTNTNKALCGASLLTSEFVLTASHCQGAFDSGVRIGIHNLNTNGVTRRVVGEFPHPDYDEATLVNDIMLIKLDRPADMPTVDFEWSDSQPATDESLTVMGFGTTSENGGISNVLRQVDVSAMSSSYCTSKYGRQVQLDVMFCAGVNEGGKDSCQGDSGGPILDQQGIQVGIVSWGIGCARASHPGVYTRVGAFSEWIKETICENSSDPPLFCQEEPEAAEENPAVDEETDATIPNNEDETENDAINEEGVTDTPDVAEKTEEPNVEDVDTSVDMVDARLEVTYDFWARETSWTVQGITDAFSLSGPDFTPYGFETVEVEFSLVSGATYLFTLEDAYDDGFGGSFAIFSRDSGGDEALIISGPNEEFDSLYEVEFTVPGGIQTETGTEQELPPTETPVDQEIPSEQNEASCVDSNTKIYFERDLYGGCAELGRMMDAAGYLCEFIDVALACPQTCGTCEAQTSVTEDECARDLSGTVDMGDLLGDRDCGWLRKSIQEGSNRFAGMACGRTDVAFHCAQTCAVCTDFD